MAPAAALATSLIQTGLLLAGVLLGQMVAVRHLQTDAVPRVLRGRVATSTRIRPWLLVTAISMAAAGCILYLR